MPSPPHNPRRSLMSSRLTMRAESLGARDPATVLFPENDVPHIRTSLVPDATSASNSIADAGATRNQNAGASVLGGVVGARLLGNRAGALWLVLAGTVSSAGQRVESALRVIFWRASINSSLVTRCRWTRCNGVR